MAVIGTAGHVDHGKSALVEALTGVNPDRLREERERGMTIDLGFGWFNLPDGQTVGVVDVPGHRDFLENMLSGLTGLDLILLVIAADEGVMPQTREHLQIIDLLGLTHGVVVLTKADLVTDDGWWPVLEEEVRSTLAGTVMEKAPWVRFSAVTDKGKEDVLRAISSELRSRQPRPDSERPRLAVDRVFHVQGFGPVVTGTLTGGSLRVGMDVRLQPGGGTARIRGIQSYHQPVELAQPGNRIALNLAGIDMEQIRRGDVVTLPGTLEPSTRIHANIRLLAGIGRPVKHLESLKVFAGASESMVQVRLLEGEKLPGGAEGYVEIEFEHPLALERGDRFILRRPSPPETVGGGLVISTVVRERARRHDQRLLADLAAYASGKLEERLLTWMAGRMHSDPAGWDDLPVDRVDTLSLLERLVLDGRVVRLKEDLLLTRTDLDGWSEKIISAVSRYHDRYPLRPGLKMEEVRLALQLERGQLNGLLDWLQGNERVVVDRGVVRLPEFRVTYTRAQQASMDSLFMQFAQAPFHPPLVSVVIDAVGEEVFQSLLVSGALVRLSEQVVMRSEDWDRAREVILSRLEYAGQITLAEVRDLFSTSRKFAQAVLEALDQTGDTVRVGEVHRQK